MSSPTLTSTIASGSGGSGGISYSRRAIATNATASASDTLLGITTTNAIELRLAPAEDLEAGQYLTIKKEVSTDNLITISTSGSQTIDGESSVVLESPHAALNLYSNGSSAYFIY